MFEPIQNFDLKKYWCIENLLNFMRIQTFLRYSKVLTIWYKKHFKKFFPQKNRKIKNFLSETCKLDKIQIIFVFCVFLYFLLNIHNFFGVPNNPCWEQVIYDFWLCSLVSLFLFIMHKNRRFSISKLLEKLFKFFR